MKYHRRSVLEVQSKASRDLNKHYDPETTPWRDLAIAVIFETLKDYVPGRENASVREFFEGDDYILWGAIADLQIDGKTVLRALERNGGIDRGTRVMD